MKYIHAQTGFSDTDWFRRSISEAKSDPVGLWKIVKVSREGFGLRGSVLEEFMKRYIQELVSGGAVPIVGDKSAKFGWNQVSEYGVDPAAVANALVDEWRRSGVDPDVDGVWFASPSVFE